MSEPRTGEAGVVYATTDDGMVLPVIDITHPAFAVVASEAEVAERTRAFVKEADAARQQMSSEDRALMMQRLRDSHLGRELSRASGGHLSGLATYLLKLGPDNLGPDFGELDRRIAASFPVWTVRLRLQDVVRLLSERLLPWLKRDLRQPLVLVDIAGGPAADALNVLILLQATEPDILTRRPIRIRVLDRDSAGPSFAGRALAVLRGAGAKLEGLDVALEHVPYDWSDTAPLEATLRDAANAVIGISSEGGLFDYGDDAAIVANLDVARSVAGPMTTVVGSITRGDGLAAETSRQTNIATIPRSLEGFAGLARTAGWRLDAVVERPLSHQLRLALDT